jgi:hypothetical protein
MSHIEQPAKTDEQKHQPTRCFDSYGLLACLVISVFLIVWITLASKSLNFSSVVFLFALPWVLLRAGAIVTAALRFPSFFALDFLLGVIVISVAVITWKFFVPVSLWVLLIVLLVAVARVAKFLPRHQRDPLSALGLLSVIAALGAATGWSQDLILPTSAVKDGVVFKPWSDFFFHATMVTRSLGSQTLFQTGNYELTGFPAIFYHYASYSLALCLAKVGSVPAYAAVVGFWAPFGSFLTGLASYALGRAIWSQAAGLAALMATYLIPDATLLNMGHPIYGYFWLQHVAPGGLYGVAIAGTALILVLQGARDVHRLWILSGVVLGALVALFKVHIFAAAFPLLFSFAILSWPLRRRTRWLVLGIFVATGITLLVLANHFREGLNIRVDFSGSAWYWKLLANEATGTPVDSWYRVFAAPDPFPSHLVQAIGLLLLNALGIFAVVAPLTWLLAVWSKTWQSSDGVSVAAVAILLLGTFGLSAGVASSEFMHRPFVWAYWLVGSLTAGHLFSMMAGGRLRLATWAIAVAVVVLTLVPIRYGSGLERSKTSGPDAFSNLRLDQGLIDCAYYIRRQPAADAVVQDSHLDERLILGGLSERRSFIARAKMWMIISQAFRKSPYAYQEHLRKLQNLQQATNVQDLQRSVRETGIRWYVIHPGDPNIWPAEFRNHPIFESNGYQVYDMQRCFNLRG